jgi:FMN reductase
MQLLKAVGISGSPSPTSRARILLESILRQLASEGVEVELVDLGELSADALLGRCQDASVDRAVQSATNADILLLGTPVYQATYSGLLKVFLDLFPKFALHKSVVGLVAAGGTSLHALSIDHALRPLVTNLGGLSAVNAVYVTDKIFPDKAHIPIEICAATEKLAQELLTLAQTRANVFVQPTPLRHYAEAAARQHVS